MANVKITQLPLATTPLTGTEDIPLVQGTTTKQVTVTGLFTSPVMTNPTLGTVGQADLINATGLPISTGVAGLGTGVATFLGTPSSTNLRAAVTDETGTGSLVFATSPTLVTPNLGTPSVLVATNATGTAVGLTAGSAITNANLTGAVTSVGNATSLGSFTSAQLRTALTDETGAGSAVFATSPTITAPILNQINDTNNAQILGLSPTTSAVDYLVVKNGIGVGVPLHFYADGSSANIGLHIQPKGTGLVTISDGTDFNKGIRFRSSSSAASAITLLDAVSTAGRVVTLPDATTTLVGRDTTDTLTNKTIAFGSNTFSGTLAIANGGTNASTAASAIENLLPAYAGNGSKGLRLNSGATALEWVADGGGTVTSVAATVPSFLSIAGSPITTSGTLAFSLSGTALPTTSGGTGLTSFTSGGVVYASSSSALATGSALNFNGTSLTVGHTSAGGATFGVANGGNEIFQVFAGFSSNLNLVQNYNYVSSVYVTNENRAALYSWKIGTSDTMTLTSTGLGIGTSSPNAKLNVVKSADNSRIAIGDNVAAGTYSTLLMYGGLGKYNFQLGVQNNVNNAFEITPSTAVNGTTFSTPAVVLDSSGNLGIGTSSPNAKLQISGSGSQILRVTETGSAVNTYVVSSSSGVGFVGTSSNHPLGFTTNDVERVRIDTSGNVGIGTSSPSYPLHVNATGNGTKARFTNGTTTLDLYCGGTEVYTGTAGATTSWAYANANTYIAGYVNGAERMRIDSSGNLLVGTTSNGITDSNSITLEPNVSGGGYAVFNHITGASAGRQYIYFTYGGSSIGSITQSGTTAVLYNVTSDQRLKENIQDADSASSLIDSLQVRKFDWKTDQTHQRYGFVAQELVTVAPEAVHQPTDTEQMMAVDYSKLVPMLVKEIQSLRQRLSAANL